MSDDVVRNVLRELADQAPPADGLAETALRRARRRRLRVWGTFAAGVAGVAAAAVPVSASVLSDLDSTNVAPAGANMSSELPTDESSQTGQEPEGRDSEVLPAPGSRLLADDELTEAFASCQVDEFGERYPGYDGWEPVFGITLDEEAQAGGPKTWVAARRGDDYRADCVLGESGELIAGGGEYGVKSTPALLYAVVDGQEGMGSGRFVDPVARVTVQYKDGPEQEAILHGGFWFYPQIDTIDAELTELGEQDPTALEDVLGDWDLIGVPFGYTFRGYDDAGQLVYDSSVDGPSAEDCYADPTGTEFVGSFAGHADPAECVRTHEWEPRLEEAE